jgi:NDP-sugar pyrophosphorylase family protein
MQLVVLAGGLATRMRPLTEKIPKLLIEIKGRPFGHYQLDWFAAHGVTDVVYCIGYKGKMIRDSIGDGSRWGVRVRYVDEGTELRGTGGAIRLVADEGILDPRFLVIYGDSFLPIDFAEVWRRFEQATEPALMTVFLNEGKWDSSNACVDGEKVTLYDKKISPKPVAMKFIDYGLLGLSREAVLNGVPAYKAGNKTDLAELFHQLSVEGKLAGLQVFERFYEIGSMEGLRDFTAYLDET